MSNCGYLASKSSPTWIKEYSEEHAVKNATSNTLMAETDTRPLVTNRYVGQKARITDSGTASLEGKLLNIISNTTTTFTLQEQVGIKNNGLTIPADSRVAIETVGQPPQDAAGGVVNLFGEIVSSDLPMRAREFYEGYYHGSSHLPAREEAVPILNKYEADLAFDVKSGQVLGMGFGNITESSTDLSTANGTTSGNSYPGAERLYVVDASERVPTDIIWISSSYPEMAVISSRNQTADYFVLTQPLKNYHATASDIYKVKATGGVPDSTIMHTLSTGHCQDTFVFEQTFKASEQYTGSDFPVQFMGLMVNKVELSSTPGSNPLQCSLGVQGLAERDSKSNGTTDLTSGSSVTEVGFDKGSYLYTNSVVKINGIEYGEAEDFTITYNREIETKPVHNDGNRPYFTEGDPIVHYPKKVSADNSLTVPLQNRNFYDLVKEDTAFTAQFRFNRSETTYEYMDIYLTECHITGPLFSLPEPGAIPQAVGATARTVRIEVHDYIPVYS